MYEFEETFSPPTQAEPESEPESFSKKVMSPRHENKSSQPIAAQEGVYGTIEFFQNKQGKWARKTLKKLAPLSLLREAFVGMALPSHENLIHFRNVEFKAPEGKNRNQTGISFVMPQAEDTLSEKMTRMADLTFAQFLSLVRQLFCAINVLHEAGLLHLDIKPANILVMSWPKTQAEDDVPHIKLIDYGLVLPQIPLNDLHANELITSWYRPPDFLCRNGHGFRNSYHLNNKADIFSAGMTTLELLCYWLFPFSLPTPFYGRMEYAARKKYRSIDEASIEKEVARKWMELFETSRSAFESWNYLCESRFHGSKSNLGLIQKLFTLFYHDIQYYMKQFSMKSPAIKHIVEHFLTILLPTVSFDPTMRPNANDILQGLHQPPLIKTPQEYKCRVLNYHIFDPVRKPEPFVWVNDNKQRLLLQEIYNTYIPDAKGQLEHLEDTLKQWDLPETDLFVALLVLLAFLLPRNKRLEEYVRQEQLKPDFFEHLSRVFQHVARGPAYPLMPLKESQKRRRVSEERVI